MSVPTQSIIETRRHQMFPVLEPQNIERVRRFGQVRSYDAGEALAKVGDVGHGLIIILAGHVDITQHDQSGRRTPIVTYGPGSFMGELAQLAGQRTLVDAYANEAVEALKIPPEKLRALLIAEAELGERIMRALIYDAWGCSRRGREARLSWGAPATATCFGSRAFCAATATRVKNFIPRPIQKPRR